MDYLRNLFDRENDDILEHAYRDARGDLELAIDLILRSSSEPELQRSKKRQRVSTSPVLEPSEAPQFGRIPAPEQHRRERPEATPPISDPAQSGASNGNDTLIMISDDEDTPMDLGDKLPPDSHLMPPISPVRSTEDECLAKALEVFPDISRDYVLGLYKEAMNTPDLPEQLVLKILDDGAKYPKESQCRKELKRKRQDDVDTTEINYDAVERDKASPSYTMQARILLQDEFASIPVWYINDILRQKQHLFPAYFALELVDRTYATYKPAPYSKLKCLRKPKDRRVMPPQKTMTSQMLQHGDGRNELLAELHAARAKRRLDELKRQAELDAQVAASLNEKEHEDTGMMMEWMTHCNGDECHFFCLDCAKRNADNEVGQSRYKLRCMDGSGCTAEFSRQQIQRFLDDKTLSALERIQQDDEIRMAELDGLTKCPFCDFGAICPPVEVDREFRCRNSDCEKTSCRLCRQETHIPLSCEAFAKENRSTIRHAVEEAMTEALVRSCRRMVAIKWCAPAAVLFNGKSCGNRGVNMLYLTEISYVCSKTITNGYGHFDDSHRGGGKGNCPLFDNTDQRHEDEVKNAEKAALAKIRAENPEITDDDLKIQLSETVQRDEQKRLQAAAVRHPMPGRQAPPPPIQVYQPINFYVPQPNAIGQAAFQYRPPWPQDWLQGAAHLNQIQNQNHNPLFPPQVAAAAPAPAPYEPPAYAHRYIPPAVPDPLHDQHQRRRTVLLGDRVVAVPPPPRTPPPNPARHSGSPHQIDALANALRHREEVGGRVRMRTPDLQLRYAFNQQLDLAQRYHIA
ncbi:hypothetical protein FGG08_000411 [Glutinoglossum americanum]|uniref:RING-type domain-containing protein n=1 Tax=Glutinoglossum americanum TaxID=1670608 RepID=A0A9P8L624_9PEZI|nr:hypothetical protein FGG08_000411 [Glutinoglossum americanum]